MNFVRLYKLLSSTSARNFRRVGQLSGQHLVRNYNCDRNPKIFYKNMSFCSWVKEEVYRDHFESGVYVCSECGHKLFSSVSKYEHDTPWPAFARTISEDSVSKVPEDDRPGAIKVSCGSCGNGLGHEFLKDGPDGTTSRF